MRTGHKNYLTNLLGFTDSDEIERCKFLEEELQSEFDQYKFTKQVTKSNSMTFFFNFPNIIIVCYSLYMNMKPIRPTYCIVAGIILDVFLSFVFRKFENSLTKLKWFRYIRFFLFYFNLTLNWIFPVNNKEINVYRFAYFGIFYVNFLHNYYLEFNYYLLIVITFLNSLVLVGAQYSRNLGDYFLLPEVATNIVYYYIYNLLKKSELESEKISFIKSYKNNNYIEYIQNLVNVLNTMIISIKNEDILFMNDCALNYFKNNTLSKINRLERKNTEDSYENDILINDINKDQKPYKIHNKINEFLNSLILNSSSNYEFVLGLRFREIIHQICSENKLNSVNFLKLGYFTHLSDKNLYYEIHARKLKYREEALELLIYNISEIKLAENQAIETKYKHKILAKIAHEFKTPLITIIALIERIAKEQERSNFDLNIKKNLYYINNLSNYTLSLISDIIQYVSEYVDLRINKNEVNLKEVMDFSNNVLKTLIECNENKSEKIQTSMEIKKNIDNIKVYTDENRLKQILLNFISNAFKFTQHGFIKIKAKYLNESNYVEISVKDSGIGIKEEDHDLIFRENLKLNVDNEYNQQGSGLGLSIVKNLANYLDYKIGFKSTFGKGSKFYIRIHLNESNITRSKSFSFKFKEDMGKNTSQQDIDKIRSNIRSKINKTVIYRFDSSDKRLVIKRKGIQNDSIQTKKVNLSKKLYQDSIELSKFEGKLKISRFNLIFDMSQKTNNSAIKLVIVDDHKLVREYCLNILRLLLKDFNNSLYEIVECSDGIELLNEVRLDTGNKIKLILTDENMEYLNGSESVRIIRNLEENRKIKQYHIVSITAFDDQETKERILNSGVNSIITKPCTKSVLSKLLVDFFIPHFNK
jgi:signal transduction histidine kinase/CheY-like chemotaxis protein